MTQHPGAVWPWLFHTFGEFGAFVFVLIALVLCVSWLVTPVLLWRLYRKHLTIERTLAELFERFALQSRQHQADRLRRDKSRARGRRRRRSRNARPMPET